MSLVLTVLQFDAAAPASCGSRTLEFPARVSAFEQTGPAKVLNLVWIGIPREEVLSKPCATRDSYDGILADVAICCFLTVSSGFQPGSRERAELFVVFSALDSTEAERLSGESRLPLSLGLSKCLTEIYITSKATRRNQMDQSTKDETRGNIHEAKGAIKEKVGQVINNPNLTAEGQNEKLAGKVQKKVGQIEKVLEK
jgi:uncharacterized protein YjbJ (UPF0337 family)